jgi:signal transduction histidine kinase
LNKLVSTLLDSARPRPPSLRSGNMHDLIRHSLSLLASHAEKKDIHLLTRFEIGNPIVECDIEQMTQVLLNLVLNAIQILPTGGTVEVACRPDRDAVVITVSDSGPGIPLNERALVFDSFFSRREGGIGLGLAIVQQLVTAHGGTISAGESALGGAQFTINLPRNTLENK